MTDFLDEDLTPQADFDLANKLLDCRLRMKLISQLSYELREIDRAFPSEHYDQSNAEGLYQLYLKIEDKVLEMAEEIKRSKEI